MAFSISNTLIVLCCLQILAASYSSELTMVNNCNFTIQPAVLSNSGTVRPSSTGSFSLQPGESKVVEVPRTWSGRILGPTLCSHDSNGVFNDECPGGKVAPPATFAEFFMNSGDGGLDLYDVSLVEGYNLPMIVEPEGRNCTVTECVMDLNTEWPWELKMMSEDKVVGCKSPCQAFGDAESCCTRPYASPERCIPTSYALFFKTSCPQARLSLYDQTPSFSFLSTNYLIKFCSHSYIEPQNRENPTKKFNWKGLANVLKVVAIILVSMATIFGIAYNFFSGRGRGTGEPVDISGHL